MSETGKIVVVISVKSQGYTSCSMLANLVKNGGLSMDRRKGVDRRQQDIEVYVDRRISTERRVKDRRSGLERRIQQIEVSKDRRTYDRRRAWV